MRSMARNAFGKPSEGGLGGLHRPQHIGVNLDSLVLRRLASHATAPSASNPRSNTVALLLSAYSGGT